MEVLQEEIRDRKLLRHLCSHLVRLFAIYSATVASVDLYRVSPVPGPLLVPKSPVRLAIGQFQGFLV